MSTLPIIAVVSAAIGFIFLAERGSRNSLFPLSKYDILFLILGAVVTIPVILIVLLATVPVAIWFVLLQTKWFSNLNTWMNRPVIRRPEWW